MAIFNKPEFNSVWANTGTKIDPGTAKVNQGWVVEIPAHEHDNWIRNRQDQMLAHINQSGIPAWDASAEYVANKSYVQGVNNGIIYRAIQNHTGVNPEGGQGASFWAVAFEAQGNALLKSQNLADVLDKAAARTNLGIATTADYDARYLIKAQNLADVPNKASARSNIDVYSKSEVYTQSQSLALHAVGQVSYFANQTAPAGWVICDGRWLNTTQYSRLFNYLGYLWGGSGGGFAIPNLLGEFVRGWDTGRGIDPGRGFGTVQASQNMSHTHSINDPGHYHGMLAATGNAGNGPAFDASSESVFGYNQTAPSTTGVTLNTSGGSEARPRNIALLPCIYTGVY